MTPNHKDTLNVLKDALLLLAYPDKLARHTINTWPLIKQYHLQGKTTTEALRTLLEAGCTLLHEDYPEAMSIIQERFLDGATVYQVSARRHVSRTTILRRTQPGLLALASYIDDEHDRMHRAPSHPAPPLPPTHSTLPMLGREQLVEEALSYLTAHDGPKIVILEGIGGIGKTTCASTITQRLSHEGVQIIWTSVPHNTFDPWNGTSTHINDDRAVEADFIRQCADQIRLGPFQDPRSLEQALITYCRENPCCIVFDRIDTLDDFHSLARLLTQLAPYSRVLITSRIHAPQIFPATLARVHLVLPELDCDTSIALLRTAATFTGATHLVTAQFDDLFPIYTIIGGHPLALWLIAGQARGMPWPILLQTLHTAPRDTSLFTYLYHHAWNRLSLAAQTILVAMHRHRRGVSYHRLMHTSSLDTMTFPDALQEVIQRMLIMFDGQMYSIHPLTMHFLRTTILGWSTSFNSR